MSAEESPKESLLRKITGKRLEIRSFISKTEPRNTRLINIATICSAIATSLTAAPAFGGKPLSAWLTKTLGLEQLPVWQLLCFGAMGCSFAAMVAGNMLKSHEITSKLLRAQATNAKLEGLETLIELDQTDIENASSLYSQYLNDVSFL